jgi:hypothetical protein
VKRSNLYGEARVSSVRFVPLRNKRVCRKLQRKQKAVS